MSRGVKILLGRTPGKGLPVRSLTEPAIDCARTDTDNAVAKKTEAKSVFHMTGPFPSRVLY